MSFRNNRAAPSQPPYPHSYSRISPGTSDQYGDPHRSSPVNNQGSYHDTVTSEKLDYSRGQSRQRPEGQKMQLEVTKNPEDRLIYENKVAVSSSNFPPPPAGSDFFVILEDKFVYTAVISTAITKGYIGLSDPQRTWTGASEYVNIDVGKYDTSQEGYLESLEVDVSFASTRTTETPYEQDELQQYFTQVWEEKNGKFNWANDT